MTLTDESVIQKYKSLKSRMGSPALGYKVFLRESGIDARSLIKLFGPGAYSKLQTLSGDDPNVFGSEKTSINEIMKLYGTLATETITSENRLPRSSHWLSRGFRPTESGLRVVHGIKWSEFHLRFLEWYENNPADSYKALSEFIRRTLPNEGVITDEGLVAGSVYLFKSGQYYKIGKTNNLGRRQGEFKTLTAQIMLLIHEIETDDIDGIELYWHNRFKHLRCNGEWFNLRKNHVKSFKSRKFM